MDGIDMHGMSIKSVGSVGTVAKTFLIQQCEVEHEVATAPEPIEAVMYLAT